jgi:hypothetical protein
VCVSECVCKSSRSSLQNSVCPPTRGPHCQARTVPRRSLTVTAALALPTQLPESVGEAVAQPDALPLVDTVGERLSALRPTKDAEPAAEKDTVSLPEREGVAVAEAEPERAALALRGADALPPPPPLGVLDALSVSDAHAVGVADAHTDAVAEPVLECVADTDADALAPSDALAVPLPVPPALSDGVSEPLGEGVDVPQSLPLALPEPLAEGVSEPLSVPVAHALPEAVAQTVAVPLPEGDALRDAVAHALAEPVVEPLAEKTLPQSMASRTALFDASAMTTKVLPAAAVAPCTTAKAAGALSVASSALAALSENPAEPVPAKTETTALAALAASVTLSERTWCRVASVAKSRL